MDIKQRPNFLSVTNHNMCSKHVMCYKTQSTWGCSATSSSILSYLIIKHILCCTKSSLTCVTLERVGHIYFQLSKIKKSIMSKPKTFSVKEFMLSPSCLSLIHQSAGRPWLACVCTAPSEEMTCHTWSRIPPEGEERHVVLLSTKACRYQLIKG